MTILHRIYRNWVRGGERLPDIVRGFLFLISHWIFQSMFRMDRYETSFKILCSMIFTTIIFILGFGPIISIIIGHSLNFVINSHIIAALKEMNINFFEDRDEFTYYSTQLLDNLISYTWVDEIYIIGSVNRGEWSSTSDLDVNVVRKSGFRNGVLAVLYGCRIRFLATLNRFPIDIYIWDTELAFKNKDINSKESRIPYSTSKDDIF